jgi:hypothetical protein
MLGVRPALTLDASGSATSPTRPRRITYARPSLNAVGLRS